MVIENHAGQILAVFMPCTAIPTSSYIYLFYLLYRVLDEIEEVLGAGDFVTAEDLGKLRYLDQVSLKSTICLQNIITVSRILFIIAQICHVKKSSYPAIRRGMNQL